MDPLDPDNLVEAYTFHFSYPSENQWAFSLEKNSKEIFSCKSKTDIMRATTDMIRRLLLLTQTLPCLPSASYLTMKLYYFEDVTPLDYEPPYFQKGDDSFYFAQHPAEQVGIGKVSSPYHA